MKYPSFVFTLIAGLFCHSLTFAQVKFVYDETSAPTADAPYFSDPPSNDEPTIDINSDAHTATPSKQIAFVVRSQPIPVGSLPSPPTVVASTTTIAAGTSKDTSQRQIKIYPPTDMQQNPDLQAFVKQLLLAIKQKDVNFISKAIHPEIMFGEAGSYGYGKTSFLQTWHVSDQNSPIWLYLEKAIKIGGGNYRNPATGETINDEWVFPYVCNLDIDPVFMYADVLVITSDHANVRSKPHLKAPIIAKFANDMVKVNYAESVLPSQQKALKGVAGRGEQDWYRVSSLDGKINGYVNWLMAWNPRGLRLHLTRSLDKWYISAWVGSGD